MYRRIKPVDVGKKRTFVPLVDDKRILEEISARQDSTLSREVALPYPERTK